MSLVGVRVLGSLASLDTPSVPSIDCNLEESKSAPVASIHFGALVPVLSITFKGHGTTISQSYFVVLISKVLFWSRI